MKPAIWGHREQTDGCLRFRAQGRRGPSRGVLNDIDKRDFESHYAYFINHYGKRASYRIIWERHGTADARVLIDSCKLNWCGTKIEIFRSIYISILSSYHHHPDRNLGPKIWPGAGYCFRASSNALLKSGQLIPGSKINLQSASAAILGALTVHRLY